jgi:hypothetical protein
MIINASLPLSQALRSNKGSVPYTCVLYSDNNRRRCSLLHKPGVDELSSVYSVTVTAITKINISVATLV